MGPRSNPDHQPQTPGDGSQGGTTPVSTGYIGQSQAIAQLSKIEARPPLLSVADTANQTAVAIHLLRVKNAAAQHGFLHFLIDPTTATNSPNDGQIYRRWIIESFEDRDIRALLASPENGAHPTELWAAIPDLLITGVDLPQIYTDWLNDLRWDESTNIASFYATFWLVSRELKSLGQPLSDSRLRNLYARAIPRKYQHVVTAADMDSTVTDIAGYTLYINKAINRTLTRMIESERIEDAL